MATIPENAEPGFENDVNDLPEDQSEQRDDTLEDDPVPDDEDGAMEDAQEEAAEERKEGGYQ